MPALDLLAQQPQTAIGITGQNLGLNRVPPVVEGYGQIPANTIPQNITSQLQNLQIQKPNPNFTNLRVGMADGGGVSRIQLLLKQIEIGEEYEWLRQVRRSCNTKRNRIFDGGIRPYGF